FDLSLLLRKEADEHVAACPTSWAGMAFPLRMRRKRRSSASIAWIKVGAHAQRTLLFLGEGLGGTRASVTQITALHCVHKGVANRNLLLAVVRGRTCLSLDRGIRPTEPMSRRDDCANAAHSRWARRRRRIRRKERFRPIGSTPCTHRSRGDECPVVAFCGRQDHAPQSPRDTQCGQHAGGPGTRQLRPCTPTIRTRAKARIKEQDGYTRP